MRAIQVVFLVVVGVSLEAAASPRSGGGSSEGGGRLASVSAGIGSATGASSRGRAGGSSVNAHYYHWSTPCPYEHYRRRVYDGACVRRCPPGHFYRFGTGTCVSRAVAMVVAPGMLYAEPGRPAAAPRDTAVVSGYVGGQKVFESDGAISLELAVADRRLRLAGALTRFFEEQPSGDTLTLTMPSLALGVRIDDSHTTRVYLEAGVVGAMTKNDPMADSSITGALGGVVAEHALSRHTTLIGSARVMGFPDDVRAASFRAGVRYRHVQASFSVLDFNVGPALYGPEIGIGF